MGAAAHACSALTDASGLSAQPRPLPRASDKLEPSLFGSDGIFAMVSVKHETSLNQDVYL